LVIRWSSESGETYTVSAETDLGGSWSTQLETNLLATPPVNAYTNEMPVGATGYYRIEKE
jgi:hypothetical protein